MEEELRRKEIELKLLKKDDEGAIDQEYYEMIKAKMNLLESN